MNLQTFYFLHDLTNLLFLTWTNTCYFASDMNCNVLATMLKCMFCRLRCLSVCSYCCRMLLFLLCAVLTFQTRPVLSTRQQSSSGWADGFQCFFFFYCFFSNMWLENLIPPPHVFFHSHFANPLILWDGTHCSILIFIDIFGTVDPVALSASGLWVLGVQTVHILP